MTDHKAFYDEIATIVALPPDERHRRFAAMHDRVTAGYCEAVRAITPQAAARPSSDGRTLAQVVGHIAEWDRCMVLAAGDILAGVERPRFFTRGYGYIEPDGAAVDFRDIDDFNRYQAERQAAWPWEHILDLALRSATMLHALFTHPALLSAALLDQSKEREWPLANGMKVTLTGGWFVWVVVLEHEGVEHAGDLGWGYDG
jgi:hypothetical protein